MKNRWFKTFVRIVFGTFLTVVLLYLSDWDEFVVYFNEVSLWPVLLITFLFLPLIYISVIKWNILIKSYGYSLEISRLARFYCVGFFFNNFLPSSVGGDFVRYFLIKGHVHKKCAILSIFYERFFGILVLFYLAVSGLFLSGYGGLGVTVGFVFLVVVTLVVLLTWRRLFDVFSTGLNRISSTLLLRKLRLFENMQPLHVFENMTGSIVLKNIFWSLAFYFFRMAQHCLIFVMIFPDGPLWQMFLLAPLIDLAWAVPFSINGLGLAEGACMLIYQQLGVGPEAGLLAAGIVRGSQLAVSASGGFMVPSIKQLKGASENASES